MKLFRIVSFSCLVVAALILTACNLPFISSRKKAALQVTSNPKATVFLNEDHIGQTPYFDENLKEGEYTLKIVPDSSESQIISWQGIVKLSSGILTVVNRNLGATEEESSGYVLSLEPITEKDEAKISIISNPDSVVVSLNGEPKGFTPLTLEGIEEGEHLLIISSPGFKEETIKAKTIKGHKLMINVQLAKELEENPPAGGETEEEKEEVKEEETKASPKPSPKPSPSPELEEDEEATEAADEMERPYVKIDNNQWGWLNVRSEPSPSGDKKTVLTEVHPGEVYKFIEQDENGWNKIEYEEGKQGWVSGKYTTVYQ